MKQLRKVFLVMMLLSTGIAAIPVVAADMGPKPTMTYEVVGIEPVAMALMMHKTDLIEAFDATVMEAYGWDENPLLVALNGYRDADGFVAFALYWDLMYDGVAYFYNGYPSPLKLAVMDADGAIFISEAIDFRMYNAALVFDFTGYGEIAADAGPVAFGVARERIPVFSILSDFLLRMVLTIGIELGVLWLFRYRSRTTFCTVAIANALTQALLTVFVLYGYYWWADYLGAWYILVVGEIPVFVGEMILFGMILQERKRWINVTYAFVANLISFGISLSIILLPVFVFY